MLDDLYAGVEPPPALPRPDSVQWQAPVPTTMGFFRLYRTVTAGINDHASANRWGPFEALFFDCAIAGFSREYRNWELPPSDQYLDLVKSTRFRALRVVAHAYLHVAFDLPRVLIEDLDAAEDMRQAVQRDLGVTPPAVAIITARFLDLQEVMRQSLDQAAKDPNVFGQPARLIRLLPGRSHFLDVFGNWMIALRSNALLYAQMVASFPPAQRPSELIRFQQVYDAARHVITKHPNNPVVWFGSFKTWFAAALLPVAIFAQLEATPTLPQTNWPGILFVVFVTLAAAGVGAVWVTDAWLASFADALGHEMAKRLGGLDHNDDGTRGDMRATAR